MFLAPVEEWPVEGPAPKGIQLGRLKEILAHLPQDGILTPNAVGNFSVLNSMAVQIGWIDLDEEIYHPYP